VQVIVRTKSLFWFLVALFFRLPVTRRLDKPHARG
jgi:hypothetical protein